MDLRKLNREDVAFLSAEHDEELLDYIGRKWIFQ